MHAAQYIPLRVRAYLKGPMRRPDHPIHLDGLLGWSAAREALEAARDATTAVANLPLERRNGVWAASALHCAVTGGQQVLFRARRIDYARIAEQGEVLIDKVKPSELRQETGKLKGYTLYDSIAWTPTATAWCIGEPERVRELLASITHIGKLRRLGFGAIAHWEVVEDPQAETLWRWRALPEAAVPGDGYALARVTLHPPYHDRTRQANGWVPIEPPQAYLSEIGHG